MDYSEAGSLVDPAELLREQELLEQHLPTKRALPRIVERFRPLLGIALGCGSGMLYSFLSVSVKQLSYLPSNEVAFVRMASMAIPATCVLLWTRKNPYSLALLRRSGWHLLVRSIIGAITTMLYFFALQRMPLGDVSVVFFSSPAFVALFSWWLLDERLTIWSGMAVVTTLTGSALVARPEFIFGPTEATPLSSLDSAQSFPSGERTLAVLAVFLAAILNGYVYILLRKLRREDQTSIVFHMAINGGALAAAVVLVSGQYEAPTRTDAWYYFGAIAVLGFVGQFAMTTALKIEDANKVSMARTTDIIWAYIWQLLFYHEPIQPFSIAGSVLVLASVAVISIERVRKQHKAAPEERKSVGESGARNSSYGAMEETD